MSHKAHFSDLFLERALRGELTEEEQQKFNVAIQSDTELHSIFNERKRERNLWQSSVMPDWLQSEVETYPETSAQKNQIHNETQSSSLFSSLSSLSSLFSLRALSTVAGVAMVVVIGLKFAPETSANRYREDIRTKGSSEISVELTVILEQDGARLELRDGDTIQAGAQLSFEVKASHAGYLHLLNDDGVDGTLLQFANGSSAENVSTQIPAGVHGLEQNVSITKTGRFESFQAILCESPHLQSDFIEQIPDDCGYDSVKLEKVASK